MPRDLLLMAVSLFAWGMGEGMFLYFQSLYLQKWGANPVQIGAILGMAGVAAAVTMAPAGYLADRIGQRPVMWTAWVLGTAATLMMAAAHSLPVFVAGILVYGLTAFVSAPMNSYMVSVRGTWSVERTLTLIAAIYQFGGVIGPLLGGLIGDRLGMQNIYRFSAAMFVFSTVVVFMTRAPAKSIQAGSAGEISTPRLKLSANPRFLGLLGLIFFTMMALYLPQPLTPNYLQDQHGFSLQTIGALGAAGSLGNAVIMLMLGGLRAPLGLLIGQALVALFALLLWRGNSTAVFFIGYFFVGGYRLARSMALAYARTLVHVNETGLAFGLIETGNYVATILAPLAAGLLYSYHPQWVYIASLGAIGLMLAINLAGLPRLAAAPEAAVYPAVCEKGEDYGA